MLIRYSGCHARSRLATGPNPPGGTGAKSAAARMGRVVSKPLDDCRAHRMADQYRRRRQCCRDVLDIGDIVVEPGDKERLLAAARAVAAKAEGVRRKALCGKPRQEKRLPAPRVAIAAMHEKERGLGRACPRQV